MSFGFGTRLTNAMGAIPGSPSLSLVFAGASSLDPRITFTRNSAATYFNSSGVLTSASANTPRFDYDPVTRLARGLLIEEQRTNSIRNSSMIGAVAGAPGTTPTNWAVSGSANAITLAVVATGTENGIPYVDIRYSGTPSGGTNVAIAFDAANAIAAANAQTWTGSAYIALTSGSLSGTSCTLSLLETNGASGVVDNSKAITPTSGALTGKRETLTATLSGGASTTNIQPRIRIGYTVGVAIDLTLRIGLPQLEQGAFATSAIPTTTASVQRNADSATMTGTNFSSWYNASEGALFAEFGPYGNAGGAANPGVIQIYGATASETVRIFSGGTVSPVFNVAVGGVSQCYLSAGVISSTAVAKIAGAYKANDFAKSYNGNASETDTSGTVPTVTQAIIGSGTSGVSALNGHIRRIAYYPRRLSNAELQAITS